tara:strand:+ start:95 stop:886 length:792 start_codon:yes stop_codon:yes gene_type:complete
MIRNYYTDSFKNGIVPVVSTTQLIDGTVKSPLIVADNNTPTNVATSVTIVLTTLNRGIVRGMYITAPANGGTPAWTINDNILVEAVTYQAATTTITLNKPKALVAGTALSFFIINQSSWKEYNLFIGSSPAPFLGSDGGIAVTGIGAGDAAAQADVNLLVDLGVGKVTPDMLVYNTTQNNLFIGVVGTVNDPGDFTLNANIPVAIAANDVLTFVYPAAPSVSVLTLDNQTVTITNPAQGFVLPLSVAQITGTANGLANIIAFE